MSLVSGKFALVTAGSAGLGACIAGVLARDLGMNVIISYSNDSARAQETIRNLKSLAASRHDTAGTAQPIFNAIQADSSDKAGIRRLVSETVALTGGRLDVVVSNVGWTQMRDFANLDDNLEEDDWDRCYATNVKAHLWLFHACREFLEQNHQRDPGTSVFISTASVAGVKPSGSSLAYAVSKAAQIHLMKSLATIAAPSIRVNSVSPGVLLTEWGLSFPAEKLAATKKVNKLGDFATVEDVAQMVKTFVVCRSITGQNAVIDAGFSL